MPTPALRALLVVDVQQDFCEGGSLAVPGGRAVAGAISQFLEDHARDYAEVVASRDWHETPGTNRGHFAEPPAEPDYVDTWPPHCIADSPGAAYHPDLDTTPVSIHVRKGYGYPAYSMFEGSDTGAPRAGVCGYPSLADFFAARGVTSVDVVGIAADYCCLATAQAALDSGLAVRVVTDLQAGVAPATTEKAFAALAAAGAALITAQGN